MKLLLLPLAAALLAGCVMTAPPETVTTDVPAQYRETLALDGAWHIANSPDSIAPGAWWSAYNDTRISQLIEQATQSNLTLAMAVARLNAARATAGLADADRAVQLGAGIGPTRQGTAGSAAAAWRAQFNVAYEVDLFGRLSGTSRAARLDLEAQQADYRSVLLVMQADVAQQYFSIRSLDTELDVLRHTVVLRQGALRLAGQRLTLGDSSELEMAEAQTELSVAQAEWESVRRSRDQRDHALAILLGLAPAQFSLPVMPLDPVSLNIPAGLPSDLLERRPDIARAQRQLAAANARIGVAKAAFFPSLTLTGAAGYQSDSLGGLFNWSSRSWLLGPLVGTALTMPLFDGGRNRANLAAADVGYQSLVASYRQQVLISFQEVEDNLSALRTLDRQIAHESRAADSAQQAARLADARYRNGAASYLESIDALRSSLSLQRARSRSIGQRAVASVGLIKALGGGWNVATQDQH
jgi:multidrug efflux system outer membrane protein